MSPKERVDVTRLKSVVDNTFARASALHTAIDPLSQVHSDMAKYLCVLVSSYLDAAVHQLLLDHCLDQVGPRPQRYIESQFDRLNNANTNKILGLLQQFDSNWHDQAEQHLVGGLKDSIDSLVNVRNGIAHGRDTGITFQRISDYYSQVRQVVTYLDGLIA